MEGGPARGSGALHRRVRPVRKGTGALRPVVLGMRGRGPRPSWGLWPLPSQKPQVHNKAVSMATTLIYPPPARPSGTLFGDLTSVRPSPRRCHSWVEEPNPCLPTSRLILCPSPEHLAPLSSLSPPCPLGCRPLPLPWTVVPTPISCLLPSLQRSATSSTEGRSPVSAASSLRLYFSESGADLHLSPQTVSQAWFCSPCVPST